VDFTKVKKLLKKLKKQLNSCFFYDIIIIGECMKKGFTLIELLAVIIVLGVLGVIAVPIFSNVIQSVRTKAFLESEKGIIRGLKNYLEFNDQLYPIDDEINIVSFNTLQTEQFINKVKSPLGSDCSGYVTIVKDYDDTYKFTPYYRCDGTVINSPADEGLILNYTFNDFQEPTTNLINTELIPYANYYTCSRNEDDHICFRHPSSSSATLALQNANVTSNLTTGDTYTISGYLSKNGVPFETAVPNISTYHTTTLSRETNSNGWFDFTQTFNTSQWVIHSNIASALIGDSLRLRDVQIEEKPYSTPFTNGTREGTIRDYSNNNINANLDMSLTPRWVSDKGGSYYFGGNQQTLSNTSLTLNTFTFSTWVNPFYYGNSTSKTVTGLGSSANIVSFMRTAGTYSSGPFWLEYRQNGNLDVYLRNEAAATVRVVVPLLSVDEWTLLTVTYNHVTGAARVYLNGEFAVSATNIAAGSLGPIGRIYLGTGLGTGTTGTPYNGYIDEVKLYNRILSDNEIQNIYSIEKLK
jgi:prepilin-type N-terminal cleavage/methylation domain-containing protein